MPSTSPAQSRLMAAVAHGWHKPGGGGPPVSVAKEFNQADKGGRTLSAASKGSGPRDAAYASGGPVLGKNSEFLKSEDRFTGEKNGPLKNNKTDEDWEKGSSK